MSTILITGASRGLGLEFSRQYADAGWRVIATCRHPQTATGLAELRNNVSVRELDITDASEVMALATDLKWVAIDVLLNNAGIRGPQDETATFGQLDIETWLKVMHVNAMAPLKVTEAFLDHVRNSERRTIVFISSRAGSISERGRLSHHEHGGPYIYRASKAALNAGARSLAYDLLPQGIGVLVLHPGWVRTEMGGPEATIDVQTSVAGMRSVIDQFTLAQSGTFQSYEGQIIPW